MTLRGPSAAVAKNMNASLELPTATSVRAVPVKLLFDNRIVINNHLKRARGGKISFTHLIGYAMVQALKAMPSMNYSFAEKDGKPTLVKPEHVNLGLAIDLVKPNGDRQLVVAAIKKAETLNFFEFWQAYEDIVRRARNNKLTMDDFTGVTVSLTNPGGIGTVHSVPRLMPGQSAHHGRRLDGLPGRVPGHLAGHPEPAGHLQGHDPHLARTTTGSSRAPPPASSCGSSPTSCSASTASTTTSSRRCASPTSRSAGSRTSTPGTTTTSPRPRGSSS